MDQVTRGKSKTITSWDELGWVQDTAGRRFSSFTFEEDGDKQRPSVSHVYFPEGFVVDPHTHRVDYAEILLSGTLTVGRTELHPGDVRIVRAGTGYGPQIAGPGGCFLIFIFRDDDVWNVPLNPAHMRGLTFEIDTSASTVEWTAPE
jgi:hypothetical protein